MKAQIRKIVTVVEETDREMDRTIDPPVRRAAAIAVIANPHAGTYVEDLAGLIDIGEELGKLQHGLAIAQIQEPPPQFRRQFARRAIVVVPREFQHAAQPRPRDMKPRDAVARMVGQLQHGEDQLDRGGIGERVTSFFAGVDA